jgi:hypothetical protein
MKVYNYHRDKIIPKDAVYVGRPTKWGNPYEIGKPYTKGDMKFDNGTISYENVVVLIEKMTREDVLMLYRVFIEDQLKEIPHFLDELRGKDLVCWCAPKPCHAEILIELANK